MERISERGVFALGTPGSAALIGFVLAGAGLLVANTACPRQRAWQTLLAVALGTLAILSLIRAVQTAPGGQSAVTDQRRRTAPRRGHPRRPP
jgi:hypothetical protein